MTLISVYNSDGCVGRCDAKCYDAVSPHCDCVCGGANHGAGLKKAEENTREMADSWIDKYCTEKGIDKKGAIVNGEIFQLRLF